MGIRNFDKAFLEHYQIESFFGPEKRGGQKTVHFVIIGGLRKVMKLFPYGKDERFEREMEIYKKYEHLDGLPKVYSIDEYEGETIVFEQYIEGDTLSDVFGNYAGDCEKIRALLTSLFKILTPIWQDRYVHRDLKPENIIIRANGEPVILDFGIARDLAAGSITGTGSQPATWLWAAPEQYEGKKEFISYRTDFFNLGILGFFLHQQKLPFGNSYIDINDKFKSGNESFEMANECPLKEFCTEAMRFRPINRPRLIEDLLKLLQ